MSPAGTSRLFVALWPPPDVVSALDADLRDLRRDAPPVLRWQPPRRWHVTVLFLGEFSVPLAAGAVAGAAALTSAGELTGRGGGHFGRVLWWGVDAAWTRGLHAAVCRRIGRPPDPRWRPHITLARSRGAPIDSAVLRAVHDLPPRTWRADRLRLVASTLGPDPRYDTVLDVPLTG